MQLLESNARRRRARGGTAVSVALHTAIIFAAVFATARAGAPPVDTPHAEDVVWHAAPPVTEVRTTRSRASSLSRPSTSSSTSPSMPLPVPATIVVDVGAVPTVDVPIGVDPTHALADSFPHGIARDRCGDCGPSMASAVHDVFTVERAAAPIGTVAPRYPEPLRAGGLSGRATVRFVVDTLGRVERESIRLVAATHPLFGESAVAVVPAMRFRPAEAGGHRVRQLVELPFDFVLR